MNQPLAMSLIEAILQCFEEAGVEYVFGVPGGPLTPLYEALEGRGKIRHILAKQESAAAFMAASSMGLGSDLQRTWTPGAGGLA